MVEVVVWGSVEINVRNESTKGTFSTRRGYAQTEHALSLYFDRLNVPSIVERLKARSGNRIPKTDSCADFLVGDHRLSLFAAELFSSLQVSMFPWRQRNASSLIVDVG
jgi:hypothetical protein